MNHATNLTIGIREAARALDKSPSTIGRYVAAHPALNHGTAGRPKVDLEELRRHREAHVNPFQSGSHAGRVFGESSGGGKGNKNGAGQAYAVSKAAREAILADRAQIDLDEKRGLLVPRREMEDAVYDAGTVLQRDLLELGAHLAERLAAMTDTRAIAALMETEHRRVLATLAASLRAKAPDKDKTLASGSGDPSP